MSDTTFISSGGFGEVVSISDDKAMKTTILIDPDSDDIIPQNLREINFLKWYPKNDHILSPLEIDISNGGDDQKNDDLKDVVSMSFTMKKITQNLDKFIKETPRDERIKNFYNIFSQICIGLSPLHSNGLAHSDIKPTNILIDSKNLLVWVIDFGCVHFEYNDTLVSRSAVEYMAPELFPNYKKDSVKIFGIHNDVWSLG